MITEVKIPGFETILITSSCDVSREDIKNGANWEDYIKATMRTQAEAIIEKVKDELA